MPETLPATVAELDALLEAARAETAVYQAQHAAGRELTSEDIAALRGLAGEGGAIDTITAARDVAAQAEADHSVELNGLLSRAAGTPPAAEAPADEPEGES